MIRVADYVIQFLLSKGIRDVFMISGGGIIHLVDAVGRNKDMNYFCNYNEQATAYCVEGYARVKNGVSACILTTGPGSTNAISGVAGGWVDSVPMMIISGQVKREMIADYSRLRQLGEQEINIVDMVKPVTKYAVTVMDAGNIGYELEKAYAIATSYRPGPVWINIPLDVQGSFIDESKLRRYPATDCCIPVVNTGLSLKVKKAVEMLRSAKRPLFLFGAGIRLSSACGLLDKVVKLCNIPILLSFNGMDLITDDNPLFIGKPGIIGQRRANFALQNSDCLLSVGSRLNVKIVGYNYKAFAPKAKKIIVDIDPEELAKPTVTADLAIQADAGAFLTEFLAQIQNSGISSSADWINACNKWRRQYPNIIDSFYADKEHVNTYVFYDKLSDILDPGDIVVSGNGMAAVCLYQAFKVKACQRVFTNNGYGAMGWDLPAAIGASIASGRKRVICVSGDGSFHMNIQELEFLKYHELPVKLFVINNQGYSSIRGSQDNFFDSFYIAADGNSGVGNPDFSKIAAAYGIAYERISNNNEIDNKLIKVLSSDSALICELNVSPSQGIVPKAASSRKDDGTFESRPLEDMFPFLPADELMRNMEISNS